MMLFYKMNFKEKQFKKEIMALTLFVFITFGVFYVLKIEFSIGSFLMKVILFLTYIFLISLIFDVKIKSSLKLFKKT